MTNNPTLIVFGKHLRRRIIGYETPMPHFRTVHKSMEPTLVTRGGTKLETVPKASGEGARARPSKALGRRDRSDVTDKSHRKPISLRELGEVIALAGAQIRATGRTIETTTDFESTWAEVVATTKGRVNKESSPHHSDLTAGDACYVVVRGDGGNGAIEGFAAIRHYRLGHDCLATYLIRQFKRIYGDGRPAIDPDRIAEIVFQISGNVAQISDIFVEENARALMFTSNAKNEGKFSAQSLMAFAYAHARLDHDPDHIFGFSKARDAARGLATRYLATNIYPNALSWLVETPNRRDDDYFLHMDRNSVGHVLRHFLSEASSAVNTSSTKKPHSLDGPVK